MVFFSYVVSISFVYAKVLTFRQPNGIQITDCSTNIPDLGMLIHEEVNKVLILDELKQ